MITAAERAGDRIRKAREGRGWKLRELADATGLDFGFVGKVERGALASVPVYERLAEAVGLTLDALFDAHGPRSVSTEPTVKGSDRGGSVRSRASRRARKPSNRSA
jgi:transcriptional regulator with XRE-family HTH domain